MSAHCSGHAPQPKFLDERPRYRRILWIALIVNAVMLVVELAAGYASGSVSLLADAIDFGGDALNYSVSLAVLSAALAWRARAAMLKAVSMAAFGLLVLGRAAWSLWTGQVPEATTMGAVGLLAFGANLAVAWMLFAFRDANMRSVWLCTRNDAIGNVAVMAAALGVLGTGVSWPDLVVATLMALVAIHSAWQVFGQARLELDAENGSTTSLTMVARAGPVPAPGYDGTVFRNLLGRAKHASDLPQRWLALEAAHVLGQRRWLPHVRSHAHMLALACQAGDGREVRGQLFRLLMVPLGHLTGRLPVGNSGRSNISPFRPMPVSREIMELIDQVAQAPGRQVK
jgi:Co/Zn/Cd efflux system component